MWYWVKPGGTDHPSPEQARKIIRPRAEKQQTQTDPHDRLFEIIARHGPLTVRDIAKRMGAYRTEYAKELERRGLIRRADSPRPNAKGRKPIVWEVT